MNYVIIDVETTGLNAKKDKIIEIGAVKIQDNLITSSFAVLVNPRVKIDRRIIEITGITNEMVQEMPVIDEVIADLRAFIGDSILVAHNAKFDKGFLEKWLENRQWIDSIAFAKIVCPACRSYSLANLMRELKIEAGNFHRALADAEATAKLFLFLIHQLETLDVDTQKNLLQLSWNDVHPLDRLIVKILNQSLKGAWIGEVPIPQPVAKTPELPFVTAEKVVDEDYSLPPDLIADYLGADGVYGRQFEDFEDRPQQREMAEAVVACFNQKKNLLVEAGTGVGKSLAYLLPAVFFAANSGQKVVISTHTINLQEQLLNKDIPKLENILDKPIKAVVIKGRNNYVCRRSLTSVLSAPPPNVKEFLMRIVVWLEHSSTGDIGELSLTSYDAWKWQLISACKENCSPLSCPYRRKNCFLSKVRNEAQQGDILILNHSLLIANSVVDKSFLPDFAYLIIDEAHQLEKSAEEQLSSYIDLFLIANILSRLSAADSGALARIKKHAQTLIYAAADQDILEQKLSKLDDAVKAVAKNNKEFFAVLQALFVGFLNQNIFFPASIRIKKQGQERNAWVNIAATGFNLQNSINDLNKQLLQLMEYLQLLEIESESTINGLDELHIVSSYIHEVDAVLDICLNGTDDNYVFWVEFPAIDKLPSLHMAPIDIKYLLSSCVFAGKESIILTSATITVNSDFAYFKNAIGIDLVERPLEEKVISSPFAYQEQVLLSVCDDLPDPARSNEISYIHCLADRIVELIKASNGRALILFTSHYQLKTVFELIREPLSQEGIVVLAHGITGSRAGLIERLKTEPKCCILGANSFWEGVDVVGDALSLVAIVRLPFWPPITPVTATRLERLEAGGINGFMAYSLPQAIIRFKQGFGRLIRSTDDCGVFCVLDRRILQKQYGKVFLNSLPQTKMVKGNIDFITDSIRDWLN